MTHPNPYIGPRAFQTGEILYGREREIQELLDLLIAERIVLLHSPSGAGKSSLVYAGLIPRLKAEGFHILPTARVNLDLPPELSQARANRHVLSTRMALEEAFTEEQAPSLEDLSEPGVNRNLLSTLRCLAEAFPDDQAPGLDELASLSLDSFISRIEASFPEDQQEDNLLIFDQFEEILTVDPAARVDKVTFFNQLGVALRNRNRWALFVMREDFVAALSPYLRAVPTRLANTYRLDLLGTEAAHQAIQKPAEKVGVEFTDEASQRLVDDLRRIRVQRPDGSVDDQLGLYVEPVQLQVVCYRLWENIDPQAAKVTERDVLSIGNVDTALGDYYAERVATIAGQSETPERIIRDWFNRKLITAQGVRGQVLMGTEHSEGLPNTVIQQLENAYLVRAEKRGGAIWFELSHDRLIKPIQENNAAWLNAHLNLLQRQTSLWEERSRNEALLLREKALEEAEAWAISHAVEMTPIERDYLKACQEKRKGEAEAKALAEKEIQLQEQARSAVRLRRRAYVLAAALLVTVILTVVAIFLGNQAAQNATIADQNAAVALVNQNEAETASVLEAIQRLTAVAASTRAVAQQALAETASTQAVAQAAIALKNLIVASTAEAQALAQKATAQAASTQVAQQAAIAQAASTQAVAQRSTAEAASTQSAANAAEAQAALAKYLQQTQLTSLTSQALSLLSKQPDLALLLSLEANRLADTVESRYNLLVALTTHARLVTSFHGSWNQMWNVAFSADQQALQAISNDNLWVWTLGNGQPMDIKPFSVKNITQAVFSPEARVLAVAPMQAKDSKFSTLILWDVSRGANLFPPVEVYNVGVSSLAFSPDGRRLAVGTIDGHIRTLQTQTGKFTGEAVAVADSGLACLAFSADGRWLATGDWNGNIFLMNAATLQPVWKGIGKHTTGANALAFSPDGSWLVSGGEDGNIIFWEAASGQAKIEPLTGHSSSVTSLTFSPDGKTLASGGGDAAVFLWDVVTQEPLGSPLTGHNGAVMSLQFSADGHSLAAGSNGGLILVWDLSGGNVLGRLLGTQDDTVNVAAFNSSGSVLASGGADGAAYLWNTIDSQVYQVKTTSNVGVKGITFMSQGGVLALLQGWAAQDRAWGVDVSRFNGEIDWQQVKQAGASFALVKATEGLDKDQYFDKNWGSLYAAGLLRGAYHYFRPAVDAMAQAEFFVGTIGKWEPGDLPPVLDFEVCDNVSQEQCTASAQLFLTEVEQLTQRQPIVATYKSFWVNNVPPSISAMWSSLYPLWVFSLSISTQQDKPILPGDWKDWIFWLYNDNGSVPGIKDRVDLNWFNGSLPDLQAYVQGRVAISGTNSTILWDVDRSQAVGNPIPFSNISSSAFSRDGTMLAIGTADGSIQLWDAVKGQAWGSPMQRGARAVLSLAFSSDGKWLIVRCNKLHYNKV